jgi:hypothetical protein
LAFGEALDERPEPGIEACREKKNSSRNRFFREALIDTILDEEHDRRPDIADNDQSPE